MASLRAERDLCDPGTIRKGEGSKTAPPRRGGAQVPKTQSAVVAGSGQHFPVAPHGKAIDAGYKGVQRLAQLSGVRVPQAHRMPGISREETLTIGMKGN